MKLIEKEIYLETGDWIACGLREKQISESKSKGRRTITVIDDPSDRRKALVHYESLPAKYKDLVIARLGDPNDIVARQPIRSLITNNIKVENFYLSYKFENGNSLPLDNVKKYLSAACFLEMLIKVDSDKTIIKKQLQISLAQFYDHAISIIKSDGISLPTRYEELRKKVNVYKSAGPEALIEKWRFNNSHAAKIADDISTAVLYEMIADDSQHDDTVICRTYNKWAKQNGYKPIVEATVGNHRRLNEYQLQLYRDGNKAWYNNYGKQIMRARATAPLLLVGGDGNDWDMFFQTTRNNQVYYFDKFVLVVVMDSFNDYVLGWSIGKQENIELIKAAWIDALVHIKELTGSYYLPHQLQTDHFAHTTMREFYSKMVENYHPAAAKAPRGKYIERAFGSTWHQVLKQYKNYSGYNITAKTRINPDRIEREKKSFPNSSEAFLYATDFITQLRNLPSSDGLTKQQQWIAAFAANAKSQERLITDEQFLVNYGYSTGRKQTITNRGLTIQISNSIYSFEIPDEYYLTTVGKSVQVIYDPYDFSRVLITDGAKLRVIAKQAELMPAAKADYQEGDEARFWSRMHKKKTHMEQIADAKRNREQTLLDSGIDANALLQSGTLIKELKQSAELTYTSQLYNSPNQTNRSYDPLENM